jgi:NADH-quinone oxidoreductase subunit J
MRNEIAFYLVAAFTVAFAIAAMTLRDLVHCALCAAGAFAGLAMLYLQLDAEFVGFAQLLVYVGAIAVLILFAVLLTRGDEVRPGRRGVGPLVVDGPAGGGGSGSGVFAIAAPILLSPSLEGGCAGGGVGPGERRIGEELMTRYVMPLEACRPALDRPRCWERSSSPCASRGGQVRFLPVSLQPG